MYLNIRGIFLCFWKFKGTLQGYNTVKYRLSFFRIVDICTEEAISYKLIAVISFCFHKLRFYISGNSCQRVRIQVQGAVLFVIDAFFFVNDIFVKTDSDFSCLGSFYPVNSTLYFTSIRSNSAFSSCSAVI